MSFPTSHVALAESDVGKPAWHVGSLTCHAFVINTLPLQPITLVKNNNNEKKLFYRTFDGTGYDVDCVVV